MMATSLTPDTLYHLFQLTLHPDAVTRQSAEKQLTHFNALSGFTPLLLEMVVTKEPIPLGIRQAAVIYLKNRITKTWIENEDLAPNVPADSAHLLLQEDRVVLRERLLSALVHSPLPIQRQMQAIVEHVLRQDFPERMPHYVSQVLSLLQQGDESLLLGALIGALLVVGWRAHDEKGPHESIAQSVMPVLVQLLEHLVQLSTNGSVLSDHHWLLMKQVLKCYRTTCRYALPVCLQQEQSIGQWCRLLSTVLQCSEPEQVRALDEEERPNHPYWQAKKWAMHCVNLLFHRYGNPSLDTFRSEKYRPFAEMFLQHAACPFVELYLNLMMQWIGSQTFLTQKCLQLLSDLLATALQHKKTWHCIHPRYTQPLITQFIHPLLCHSAADEQLWQEDPYEYVHKKYDPFEGSGSSAVTAAQELLLELVRARKKVCLMPTISFIYQILSSSASSTVTPALASQIDGALCMLGTLADTILSTKQGKQHLKQFMQQMLPSLLQSSFPFLRAKSCWLVEQLREVKLDQDAASHLFQALAPCLSDSAHLPIQVRATSALDALLDYSHIQEQLRPSVAQVMQQLLHVTHQSDMDYASQLMERLVALYPNEIAPVAEALCEALRETFLRQMRELEADDENAAQADNDNDFSFDEASNKLMSAAGVIKTVTSLLLSLDEDDSESQQAQQPSHRYHLIQAIEKQIAPMYLHAIQSQWCDVYDEVFELLEVLTYSLRKEAILPSTLVTAMQTLLQQKEGAFTDQVFPFLDEFTPWIESLLLYGVNSLNETHFDLIIGLFQQVTALKEEELNEHDLMNISRLLQAMTMKAMNLTDTQRERMIFMTLSAMQSSVVHSVPCQVYLCEVILSLFYRYPESTLIRLNAMNALSPFLTQWMHLSGKMTRVYDRKLNCLALMQILSLSSTPLPVEWRQGLINAWLDAFTALPRAEKHRQELEDEESDDEDDEEEEDGAEDEIEDEIEDDENENEKEQDSESEYLKYLKNKGFTDDEDDEEDFNALDEDPYMDSALDETNLYPLVLQWFALPVIQSSVLHEWKEETKLKVQQVLTEGQAQQESK